MTGVEKNAKIPPEKSPSLPGFSVDANVCRNPACPNFGISEGDLQSAKFGYEYKSTNGVLKHFCKRCKQTHLAYSNVSALDAFHRCLANSIPYASCPNQDCKNHYVNLFEHYHDNPRDKRDKLYRVNVSDDVEKNYQARCRSCDSTFPLSKPLRLHTSARKSWQKDIDTFIQAIVDGSGPSNVMNQMRIRAVLYYSQLKAASNALLNFNNYHLINLMKPSVAPEQLSIYTDCIVCSIKMQRNDQRQQQMKIIVSTCVQNNRSLILAFHPLFDDQEVDDNAVASDHKQPLEQRRFAYLKHPFNAGKDDPLRPIGIGGCFMEEAYAYLGHFLVLRKLLSKVKSVEFYMDGEAQLYNAALNAFSDRIKSGTCDVVVRILETDKKGSQSRLSGALAQRFEQAKMTAERAYRKVYPDAKKPSVPELRKFSLSEEMKRVNEAVKTNSTKKNGALFPEPLARIYSMATRFANTSGKDLWAISRINDKHNPESRMLWLTRTAERSNKDHELNLYLNGSNLFYIDHVFGAFRHRSSLAARPGSTASGHKSYNRNPELPGNLIQDFTINVAFWNFFLKYRSVPKETIAYVHGLVRKPGCPDTKVAFQPLYTFDNAKRISKWLGT
jgi:hypothetical protein